ncbi:hypothetical protein EDI_343360 [Entamoeba dispar SAW760]|uniref:Uncharacterized protein n=1 Tax=Entamoeba dispar (strain ATCC PRA-260 / SAW760) TaxID=370354 RepID=B0ESW7_ENTDS|nr:uncharacterized protein EDI_343360 [Entamoeba dispar SAW760]EDR22394.1 hypothetical protein EDI_343360 [Entamoeba dispar SAW760]|eukprot:EDR22394.1 hypothetical protein EDI_343360 [Entamoeba dispar SAW760]
MEHHSHCHEKKIKLPPYQLTNEEKMTADTLVNNISEEKLLEAIHLISIKSDYTVYLFEIHFIDQVIKIYTNEILPKVKPSQILVKIIELFDTISETTFRNLLFSINILSLLIPVGFCNEVPMVTTQAVLHIYDNLIYDEESALFSMSNQIFPLLMIWSEFGNSSVQLLSIEILIKLCHVKSILIFLSNSPEKINSFITQFKKLHEQPILTKKIDELFNIVSSIPSIRSRLN